MSPSVTPFSVTPSKKNEEKDTEIRYSWEVKGLSNIKRDYGWKRVSEQEREEQRQTENPQGKSKDKRAGHSKERLQGAGCFK